ncbi:MAG: tetratricopeptide repeat protein [Bacteroidota bacterium]|nr:tetratricopeptide repeat protein [Bacteroidota bacterium]
MKCRRFTVTGKISGLIILCISLDLAPLNAQILSDSSSVELIRRGISDIYNFRFTDAEKILDIVNSKYPGHPVTYLYKGMMMYWQNYPLSPDNPKARNFEAQVHTSMRTVELKEGWDKDPEKLFIDLCGRALLLLYYTDNDMRNEVIPISLSTYKYIRKAFEFDSQYQELSYFTGIYNYYREAYPEHHPVYKAVSVFFPHGDKQKGLTELEYSAENSVILKAEAYIMLSWINIYYEKKYSDALNYGRTLYNLYPDNLYFKGEYIKILLLLKKYEDAEKLIRPQSGEENGYYQGQLAIFNGLLEEKKYHNYSAAGEYYKKGMDLAEKYGAFGEEFADYGRAGLKRVKDLKEGKSPERRKKDKDSANIDILSFDE